ncbi:translation initiation factor IF-3 [Paenibacillus lautus]|uniref:translation initiation factor IF-3 n=1 Tax=Paenibacillus lautus TaxID=1401 RepID=UPI002DB8A3B4|nr:translation initiation factor IF-3 [Paenibacillus lautus]MEC0255642.1 translation initiation factor IF-3 [Paenibacillus lautus]MEC0305861.1 translation initiation factor IF-3 [Paenibacillus lautus]
MLVMNEKIKAREVELTGLNGEDLGVVSKDEALALAKSHKADLVCTSLFSSPPPCKLVSRGQAKQEAVKEKKGQSATSGPMKVKEFRLSVHIEEHDYDTKLSQMHKLLAAGKAVQPVIRIQGKEGEAARKLLERLVQDLAEAGKKETGIQVSGKQATVKLLPN